MVWEEGFWRNRGVLVILRVSFFALGALAIYIYIHR